MVLGPSRLSRSLLYRALMGSSLVDLLSLGVLVELSSFSLPYFRRKLTKCGLRCMGKSPKGPMLLLFGLKVLGVKSLKQLIVVKMVLIASCLRSSLVVVCCILFALERIT